MAGDRSPLFPALIAKKRESPLVIVTLQMLLRRSSLMDSDGLCQLLTDELKYILFLKADEFYFAIRTSHDDAIIGTDSS